MKSKKFLKGRRVAHSFIAGALVLFLLFAFLPGCAPEVAPPPEEEEEVVPPPVVEPDPYEEYVAGLPEGCFPVPRECFEQAQEEGELYTYDWADWWPAEAYENFSKEFGIKMTRDYYATVDELVAKFRLYPEMPFDWALPDSYSFVQMKELDVLHELNHDWIPNVNNYYPEGLKSLWCNPDYKWGVNYETTIPSYIYNSKYIDEPHPYSWSVILEPDEKYRGKITMQDNMFQCVGSALKCLGYSYCSDDEEELMEAKELLLRQKPYVLAYDSTPRRLLANEEAWLSAHFCGDAWFYHGLMEDLYTGLPSEGSFRLEDILIIPIGAAHPAAAHLWINYLYRPDVSALVTGTVGMHPTNTAGLEFFPKFFPEELMSWPGLMIPEEYWDKCDVVEARMFTGKGLELRSKIWEELKA